MGLQYFPRRYSTFHELQYFPRRYITFHELQCFCGSTVILRATVFRVDKRCLRSGVPEGQVLTAEVTMTKV